MAARFKALEVQEEGFWYSEYEPHYPMPVPDVLTQEEANEIADLIEKMQKREHVECTTYRGPTRSRITGESMGSREYQSRTWRWPEDFGPHYVRKHRVKPTDAFLHFIGYKR